MPETQQPHTPMPNATTTSQPDWFPVDAAKTLCHQDLLGLKFQELGAFWMLRLFCWKDGSVPASPKRLAVLCRSTEKQMERLLERLSHLLEPDPDSPNRLIMPMVEEDRPEGFERKRWTSSATPEPKDPQEPPAEVYAPVPADASPEIEVEEPSAAEQEEEAPVATATTVAPPAKLSRSPAPPESDPAEIDAPVLPDAPPEIEVEKPPAAAPEEEASVATATTAAPLAKLSRSPAPPELDPPDDQDNDASPAVASAPENEPAVASAPENEPAKKKSFFMEQESVFDAHDLGLCTLSQVRGEPERFKPERHYRMKASRRRAVAAAIQKAGLEVARQAARNLPLSVHLYDDTDRQNDLHPLDIERAFRNPEKVAQLFHAPDEELAEAIRERWKADQDELLEQAPAPWQPPPELTTQRLF